nr:class I SAM-dependent methyltransferase [uncultured Cupriavidus sp.]
MQVCIHCGALEVSPTWECGTCGWQATNASGVVILAPHMIADHDGFDEALFETYDAIERHHFWFAYRRKLIIGAMKAHFPATQSFLDIGCGTAETLNAVQNSFPDVEVCGGEPSLLALQMARHKTSANLLQMDARAMPFREAFDGGRIRCHRTH